MNDTDKDALIRELVEALGLAYRLIDEMPASHMRNMRAHTVRMRCLETLSRIPPEMRKT
jgi:hypothetical protein